MLWLGREPLVLHPIFPRFVFIFMKHYAVLLYIAGLISRDGAICGMGVPRRQQANASVKADLNVKGKDAKMPKDLFGTVTRSALLASACQLTAPILPRKAVSRIMTRITRMAILFERMARRRPYLMSRLTGEKNRRSLMTIISTRISLL
jgi:hypothetical protein